MHRYLFLSEILLENRAVSNRGLKDSLPNLLHPDSIKLVIYKSSRVSLFEAGFTLRCFQNLSLRAWLPGLPCRTTRTLEARAARSFRTKTPFSSDTQHIQQIVYQLSHDVVNPAHDAF